jgi:hypothetical protein
VVRSRQFFFLRKMKIMRLLCIAALTSVSAFAYTTPDPCSLLSAATLEQTQGAKFSASQRTVRDDGKFTTSQCFYRLLPESNSVSLQVLSHSAKDAIHPREFWRKKFHLSKQEEAEEKEKPDAEREEKELEHRRPPQHVPGIGDEAYWVDTGRDGALYALAGDQIVRLSLGGKASYTEKLKKATALGKLVIERLRVQPPAARGQLPESPKM